MSSSGEFERELAVAEQLAREAGALILKYRDGDLEVERKAGDEPVTAADRASSALIVRDLAQAFADDVIISEENKDDLRRLEARRTWYIDPIDGTKDFIRGESGFSVMIGLCVDHQPKVGVVYQPIGDRMFCGSDAGAFFNIGNAASEPLVVSEVDSLSEARLVASKSHRDETIDRVKSALGIQDELNIGSVGLKLSLISLAERDLYVNPAPHCKSWDTAAPQAILEAAGGTMTDLHGKPLRYDERDTLRSRGMVASNGRIHGAVINKLRPLFPEDRTR